MQELLPASPVDPITCGEVMEAHRANLLIEAHRTTLSSGTDCTLKRPAMPARRWRIRPHRPSRPSRSGRSRTPPKRVAMSPARA
jgi:hypothetical protein